MVFTESLGALALLTAAGGDLGSCLGCSPLIVVGFVAYMAPFWIDAVRSHHQLGAILVINLLLGWTLVGWVVALAMACSAVRE